MCDDYDQIESEIGHEMYEADLEEKLKEAKSLLIRARSALGSSSIQDYLSEEIKEFILRD